ncbi:MAG: hypothetical protein M0R33_15630 [Methylomonas sp.]|uniref:hypothetical protein n=1 Tax=Methylomonas sp. TaxID=418 RepID=UPI0025D62F92|nr:hypothetical protein [Methylomonas sp.]MCK9607874.1 hypothetical protein [Methylomonas sp.]
MQLLMGALLTSFVLVAIISFLTLSWFKKRKQHRQLEQLLNEIEETQNSRKTKLSQKLTLQFEMTENDAQGVSEQLIGAEKLFLQQYIDQLLNQKPSAIVYDQVCELLDYYLDSLALQNTDSSQTSNTTQPISSDAEITHITAEPQPKPTEKPDAKPEPDWGDVFD